MDLYSADFARGPLMDYRYPPFFLAALTPLWLLPYSVAAYLWYLFGVIEIAGCFILLKFPARGMANGQRTLSRTASWDSGVGVIFGVTFAAVVQYLVMNLHYGNAQMLVTFLLFAALYLATDRDGIADSGNADGHATSAVKHPWKGRESWAAL